ncbi:MAG: hypothetical protein ACXWWQ_07575 [Candidatus Limnocylindria bacterium]
MSMESNLPATQTETALAPAAELDAGARPAPPPQRPLSVAYLPLALVVFTILAFAIAAWTFLAAG